MLRTWHRNVFQRTHRATLEDIPCDFCDATIYVGSFYVRVASPPGNHDLGNTGWVATIYCLHCAEYYNKIPSLEGYT